MQPRLNSLDGFVRTFANRGASARVRENTREAFELAVELGANGLASEVQSTADGVPILHRESHIGSRLRRRPIAALNRADLPPEVCSLAELYRVGRPDLWISLTIADRTTFAAAVTAVGEIGNNAERRLMVSCRDIDLLTEWRPMTSARLILSTQLRAVKQKPEQLAAELQRREIDGLSLPRGDWSGGLVTVLHRFDRSTFGWGAEHERELAALIDLGIDGVYSSHVDRMVAVANQFY